MRLRPPRPWLITALAARCRRLQRCGLGLLVALLLALSAAPSPLQGAGNPARVLYLNAYHVGYSWSDNLQQGLTEGLRAYPEPLEMSVEYLDSRRFDIARHRQALADLLQKKYADYPLDLVVTSDNAAFDFAVAHRDTLFPGVPLVFCGYNNLRPEVVAGLHGVTGVNEEVDLPGTIELALSVHPETRVLAFVVSTGDASSKRILEVARQQIFPRYRERFEVVLLEDLPLAEIRARLASLPWNTVVFIAGQTSDRAQGRAYTPVENSRLVAELSAFPSYGFWEFNLGTGVLGGQLLTGAEQGRAAAEMAVKILQGAEPHTVPLRMNAPTRAVFDYPVMERLGISTDRLPANALVQNRPDTLWHRHRWGIIAGSVASVLGLGLIASLSLVIRQRNRAWRQTQESLALAQRSQESLEILAKELEQRVEERTAALTLNQSRLAEAQRIAHLGHWEWNPTLDQGWWSEETFRIFGMAPRDHAPRLHELLPCIHPGDRDMLMEHVNTLLASLTPGEAEFRILLPSVGERHIHARCEISFDTSAPHGPRFVGTIQDVTERRLVHQALIAARDHAEQASRAKSDFLATMSHEIRTPLNLVIGMSDILLERIEDAEQRHYLTRLQYAGNALLGLIANILDISRIEANRLELRTEPCDLPALVRETLALFELPVQEKGLTLISRLPPQPHIWLRADATRLRQILINLLGNALKFTETGSITLTMDVNDGTLSIDVADTGIGLAPDQLERIFEKFTQAESGMTRRHTGSGLGLTICRHLVELMGGTLRVTSLPQAGSTFHLALPLSAVEAPDIPATLSCDDDEDGPRPLPPLRVLLVEDSEDNYQLIRAYLKNTPHRLDWATNGQEAVQQVQSAPYDILLMDIQMPVLDGHEATRAIRAWEKHQGLPRTPIVALTAHALEGDAERSYSAGCDAHMTKPVRKQALLKALAEWSPRTAAPHRAPPRDIPHAP
ncbi:MAG: ATP-binding protein [Magnetococcus sp. WYHC-3]